MDYRPLAGNGKHKNWYCSFYYYHYELEKKKFSYVLNGPAMNE